MRRIVFSLIFLASAVSLRAQPAEPVLAVGTRHVLTSEVLGEDRTYLVYLPSSYEDSTFGARSYPVLYLLDGDDHFHSATGVLEFLSPEVVPEHILVAIPNTDRIRDLSPTHTTTSMLGNHAPRFETSGGGDDFIDFIERELMPAVEAQYRTLPFRTFVGHSLGGLLVLHAFVHREGLFDAHIAIDPSLWWDGERLVGEFESKVAEGWRPGGIVYLSNPGIAAFYDVEDSMQRTGARFARSMQRLEGSGFRGRYEVFPGEYHLSVPLITLYYGIRHVFDGYMLALADLRRGADHVKAKIDRASEQLGVTFPVDPTVLDWVGRSFTSRERNREQGMELLKLNLRQFPESPRTHASLGHGYLAVGDTTAAVTHLKHALALRDDAEIRELIETLEGND